MLPYVLLGVAVAFEVFGDSMMKLSEGFTKKAPIAGIVVGYLVAFTLMARTLEHLPLGFVYAVWTSAGIALTAVVGALFWHEGLGVKKVAGIAVIIAGVVLLKMGV